MATYRYIKWEITKKYGSGNGIIQVGELQLMNGGYDVLWNGSAIASNPGGNNPPSEVPQHAIDGSSAAKWLDLNFSGGSDYGTSILIIDNSVDITFDSYYYVTAFDSTLYPDRNPISWTLYGSSDGSNWTSLNTINDATIPASDETPTSVFNISSPTPTPTITPTVTPSITPTVTPSVTMTVTPPFSGVTGSLYFNGINTYAYHDGGPAQTDWFLSSTYTIEFWSKAAGSTLSGAYIYTVLCQDPDASSIDVFYNNGNLNIRNGAAYCPEPIPNVWTHVAIVSDSGNLSIFYDGIAQPVTGSGGDNPSSHSKLAIGRRGATNDFQYFSGSLADIRITKNVARYNTPFDPCSIDITNVDSNVVLAVPAYDIDPLLDLSEYNHVFTNNGVTWKPSAPCVPEPTPTPTVTVTLTDTPTPTPTPTVTVTLTNTPTFTPTLTQTFTPTPTPTLTLTPTYTPTVTSTPTPTVTPTLTLTPTYTPTVTATLPSFTLAIDPIFHGEEKFLLGGETVSPYNSTFFTGDRVLLNVTQKYYSFDYYEIRSPVTVVNSSYFYISYLGFTASFDPRTEVQLNVSQDIVGDNALIIARYR